MSVKGWCPGAWRPMASGDGLVVRVRPRLARLTAAQAEGLCALALHHGSGLIDVTNRANLQLRGVAETAHPALLEGLGELGLLDDDPALEGRRNLLVAPFWTGGDLTRRLAEELLARLAELPELPAKFGFAVDCGDTPCLGGAPADIRIERGAGGLILRAEGADSGRAVGPEEAVSRAIELAHWFARARGEGREDGAGGVNPALRPPTRMARLLADRPLPALWTGHAPQRVGRGLPRRPGPTPVGPMLGLPFGQISGADLPRLMAASGARAIRVTPWRCIILEGGAPVTDPAVLSDPDDPLLGADACPGAPFCTSASVETRALARRLARPGLGLHVSGCAKGCARAGPAELTLVGRDGRFDLVEGGHAWDEPSQRGLTPAQLDEPGGALTRATSHRTRSGRR